MRASLIQRNVDLLSMILTGLYESQQEVKEGFRYWKARVSQSPDDEAAIKALKDHRKALPKFFRRIRALEELQGALKHEMKCQQCLEMWSEEGSYELCFEDCMPAPAWWPVTED